MLRHNLLFCAQVFFGRGRGIKFMSDYESVTVAASIQRFGRGRGINLESESFCEKRRKPTLPELEADYARFWEHALTELSKPVRRRPWRRLASQCSWPTDHLPESEAAAIKEEFTIASRVRKVQVALSKAPALVLSMPMLSERATRTTRAILGNRGYHSMWSEPNLIRSWETSLAERVLSEHELEIA